MTNLERFREVFGFTPDTRWCISPRNVCNAQVKKRNDDPCETCPFNDFWNKEYKPCFKMKDEFEQKSFDVYSDGTKEQIEEYEKMELDGYEQYLSSGEEGDPHIDDCEEKINTPLVDMLKHYRRWSER